MKFRKQRTYFTVLYAERRPFELGLRPRWSLHHRRLETKFKTVEEAKDAIVKLVNTATYPLEKIKIRTEARIKVVSDHLGIS